MTDSKASGGSNGNGTRAISTTSTITIGIAIAILGSIAGFAVAWGTQAQAIEDHCDNTGIHWDKGTLDQEYVPRPEIQAELRHINATLQRLETKIDKL